MKSGGIRGRDLKAERRASPYRKQRAPMSSFEISLNLLVAQAQKVGRYALMAMSKKVPWPVYYKEKEELDQRKQAMLVLSAALDRVKQRD